MIKIITDFNYENLSNGELFSVIYQCQKELLKRKIHTKFEDLRIKEKNSLRCDTNG